MIREHQVSFADFSLTSSNKLNDAILYKSYQRLKSDCYNGREKKEIYNDLKPPATTSWRSLRTTLFIVKAMENLAKSLQ